jgi:hypothetical protein
MRCVDLLSRKILTTSSEEEKDQDVQALQTIFTFLSTSVGQDALTATLSQGNFIVPFMKSIQPSSNDPHFGTLTQLEITARRGYAVEILEHVVRSCGSVHFLETVRPVAA